MNFKTLSTVLASLTAIGGLGKERVAVFAD
jgi:hypothetical protein